MYRSLRISMALGLALAVLLPSTVVTLAHGGEEGAASVVIEPASIAPGGTVLVVGTELEPEDERLVQLKGEDLTISLGTVTTTEEGRFSEEFEIPGHVPPGVYQLKAIGDETITVELQVVGSAEEGAAPAADLIDEGPRDRGVLELGFVLVLAAATAAAGVFLVLRAENLGRVGA